MTVSGATCPVGPNQGLQYSSTVYDSTFVMLCTTTSSTLKVAHSFGSGGQYFIRVYRLNMG